MALVLRLRRALAAASTSAPLLRPASTTSSASRALPIAPFAPTLLPRLPWLLPGADAGFRSTAAAAAAARGGDWSEESKISPDEILFEGCDYNHWLITMEFPDPKPSREEMLETYLQTLAKVVGSYEEAKKRMYAFSTTTYTGFQAVMTEEMSEKFRGLPGVVFILPDSYLYPETKEYGGDKYDNGFITPRPPPVHYSKPSRTDRNRNYRDSPPQQGNYPNRPPQQVNYQAYRPQQDGRGNAPQQDGRGYAPQQDGRGYAPQQNYAQAGQDARGYGPPGGFQGQTPPFQGHGNPVGQGRDYYNPQERRGGDFRPGGPSAPGTYGQPSTPGNYGQPPSSGYPGGNQRAPGVNPNYGGDNRQGTGPAYGDKWQSGPGQYPSRDEGQGNWQGRQ